MNKFKVGDVVVGNDKERYAITNENWEGVVKAVYYNEIVVQKSGTHGRYDNFTVDSKYFDLVSNNNKMETINHVAAEILGVDDKVLVEAGYLSSDLGLTDKATATIWALLFKQFKKELVLKAKEELKESKETKK